ncbi:D-isomer specific 2-hydroxyacid dehydrogenase [Diaporthe helianthi]|uniref:D-isomer specific 2-hydroxyacid dehydrogenase n=1 Tax=Diaporthe helianthi TaxID=158607 RepID=A0A2P5HI56_DIAHE|nr:D-isomer specific 2-hydroxyacid dehydrogenase [Diaporthe helianthi]
MATSRSRVLQLGAIEHAHETWAAIGGMADIVVPKSTDRAGFLDEAASGAFDGCQVAYRTFGSVSMTGRIDGELVSALPPSLKYMCHNGAGFDQIDVSACTSRGIKVSNVPTAVDDATADTAMFLMLGALRNFALGVDNLRRGSWRGREHDGSLPALGHDPQGKTLGIVGMGGIGRNMAKKALAFGMTILYHNRTRLAEHVEADLGGAQYCDLDTLLRTSDVLSLNLPLNAHTRHIISTRELALVRPGVVIVNTARGAVIDEAALVDALDSGRVASVGLDVYENEPHIHPGLLANRRALLVPHMGTWTVETEAKMEEWTMANVQTALEHGRLKSIVPEQRALQ